MFSYMGSKSKLAHLYPPPEHSTVIEPFAGSARYSLLHYENDVRLYDSNPVIISVWHYLQQATEAEILKLPDVPSKVHLDTFTQLSDAERALIGFHLCRGKAVPRKVGHGQNSWNRDKHRIASEVYKIKHWSIELKNAFSIRNRIATWFIDPPYRDQNHAQNSDRYPKCALDYSKLADWIRSRRGLVIACEGNTADYLPFTLLKRVNANTNNHDVKKSDELVYLQR